MAPGFFDIFKINQISMMTNKVTTVTHKYIHPHDELEENPENLESIEIKKEHPKTGVLILSKNPLWKRILNLFKNPITYLLYGRVEF